MTNSPRTPSLAAPRLEAIDRKVADVAFAHYLRMQRYGWIRNDQEDCWRIVGEFTFSRSMQVVDNPKAFLGMPDAACSNIAEH